MTSAAPRSPADAWLAEMLSRTREYAVIQLRLDGVIVGWFGAAARLFGYRSEDICGQPFESLFTEGDRELGIPQLELAIAMQTSRSEDDRWHVRQDGSRFWASGVVNRLYLSDGSVHGFVKVLRDRTDLRIRFVTQQNRIEDLARELARRDEAHLTLLHELRNPLSPLMNAARVLQGSAPAATQADMVKVIVRQVELMRRLVTAAEPVATEAAASLQPRFEPVVLQDALKTVVDGLGADAAARGLSLQLVVSPEPVVLEADPDQLHQMVMNLALNAIKYTPAGGRVVVSATVEGDMAAIRVEDDGQGIEKDNLERIFELFVREDAAAPVAHGYGVGLAVVKRLSALHGGFVEARSPGRGLGTQFTLQLPLRSARERKEEGNPP